MANGDAPPETPPGWAERFKTWRAVVIAVAGLVVILVITLVGIYNLPGPTPTGQVDNRGENIIAIMTATIAAVVSIVGAYFGIRSANASREQALDTAAESVKTVQDQAVAEREQLNARLAETQALKDKALGALAKDEAERVLTSP